MRIVFLRHRVPAWVGLWECRACTSIVALDESDAPSPGESSIDYFPGSLFSPEVLTLKRCPACDYQNARFDRASEDNVPNFEGEQ
jgi:hypothetical protein